MAETVNYCGTGGWAGPLPGDPDNYSVLRATPAFGGIDVSWTYPVINPSAVAHVLLYRGLSTNFGIARQVAVVSGNFFYDKTTYELPLEYFYWIQIVSINGTTGELIGPASATARLTIDQTLELLSGQIDAGALAQSLKAEIDNITLLGQSITQEVAERIAANLALGGALTAMQTDVAQAITIIEAVNEQRITDNDALASSLTLVAAGLGESIAGVTEEFDAYTSPDGAIASFKNTTEATLNGNSTTGQVGLISTVSEQGNSLDSAYTAKLTANGLIGGFGIRNDGATVEAGFDVDTFWVGRTSADSTKKPFVIVGDEVFINQAVINELIFTKLRAEDGSLIVENGKVKADFVEAQSVSIKNAAGQIVLQDGVGSFSGALSAASGTFAGELQGASGSFTGSLSGASGTFSGTLLAGTVDVSELVGQSFTYTTPGTYTATSGSTFTRMRVTCVGAGGGGGSGYSGAQGDNRPGNPGGGGGLSIATFTISGGTSVTINVPAGGAQGGPGYSASGGGGASVSGYLSAGGGGGGPDWQANYTNPGTNGVGTVKNGTNTISVFATYGAGGAGAMGMGDGYRGISGFVQIEFFNPNGVIIRQDWDTLQAALLRQNIKVT